MEDIQESKLLGPYPAWDAWKHNIENRCGVSFGNGHFPEQLFHRLYLIRREFQLEGRIDKERMETFWEEAEGQCPGFEEEFKDITGFIIQRTEIRT